MNAALPIVLLPVCVDDAALDACLGALEASTPAGTRVWLADDGQAGPRAQAVVEHWLAHTRLQADYTRRERMIGEVAHLDQMLAACEGVDVAVLAADARPLPGWLARLADCLARDPSIASATPWSNAGEAASWPRLGVLEPLPDDPERLAAACAAMPPLHPELEPQSQPILFPAFFLLTEYTITPARHTRTAAITIISAISIPLFLSQHNRSHFFILEILAY